MSPDQLLSRVGEWLRGTGPETDVVVSTRIRLARNLADYPFINRANHHQKSEIETRLREVVDGLPRSDKLSYLPVTTLNALDKQFLVERQLISREMNAVIEGPRGVAFDDRESISLMINEEDHLRLQVMRSGFALDDAWDAVDRIDDQIEAKVDYAWSEQFGYLTACPTNVGTGMRASTMLHLPALGLTRQIEKVFKAIQKINLVVRGLYGEGSRASGDFFQISNQVTLGKSEAASLTDLRELVTEIMRWERLARSSLLRETKQALQDRIARAAGTLQSATMMTSDETMELLSSVRLGIHLNLVEEMTPQLINELFLHTQPAHLQKLMGEALDGEARNAARAKYLRSRLKMGD